MFNVELLNDLYLASGMTGTEFSESLFGKNANRTIGYFNNRKSISSELLTKICYLFQTSADAFLGIPSFNSAKDNVVIGDNNNVGNMTSDDPMKMLSLIKATIKSQQEIINTLNHQLAAKDEIIMSLKKTQDDIVKMAKNTNKNRK